MEKPRSFSEMLEDSGVSSSYLTYHLENLGQLVSKTDDGKYRLSKFGEAALATMSKIEETPKESRHFSSLPLKWKSVFVVLLIGLVSLASISCIQYQSLNRLSEEYGQLSARGITPFTPKIMILNSTFPNATYTSPKLTVLTPVNATLVGRELPMTYLGGITYSNGTSVVYGPAIIPCHLWKFMNGALVVVPDYAVRDVIANFSGVFTDP
jgi:hypothetical protein